jgi:hypothetical protein
MITAYTRDLFDDEPAVSPQTYFDAFEHWLSSRAARGLIREPSSASVYRAMWGALSAWCLCAWDSSSDFDAWAALG